MSTRLALLTTRTSVQRFSLRQRAGFDDLDRVARVRLVVLVVDVANRLAAHVSCRIAGACTSRGISTRRVFAVLSLVTMPISTRLGMTCSRACADFGSRLRLFVRRCDRISFACAFAAAADSALNRLDAGDQPPLLAQFAGGVEPLGLRLQPQAEQVLGRLLQASAANCSSLMSRSSVALCHRSS